MKINRHNYEEYFILYMDNELSSVDRELVEIFVQQNPDLEEELVMLQQSKFVAEDAVVFDNKELLIKPPGSDLIHAGNYEEWLLLYNDNELTAAQRSSVEAFIASHPGAKTELDWLQQAKLVREEAIVFPGKESLYRRDEKVRVVSISWWRIAAAAVLLFAVSTTVFLLLNKKKETTEKGLALEASKKETIQNNNTGLVKTDKKKEKNEVPVIENNASTIEQKTTGLAVTKRNNEIKKEQAPLTTIKEEDGVAKTDDKNKNDLPQPTYNPTMKGNIEQSNVLAVTDAPSKEALTNLKENISLKNVTPDFATTFNPTEGAIDTEQPEKKNKLRGLFRRVTRTFEKTTGVKATDEDDRLLVGGLAIKL